MVTSYQKRLAADNAATSSANATMIAQQAALWAASPLNPASPNFSQAALDAYNAAQAADAAANADQ